MVGVNELFIATHILCMGLDGTRDTRDVRRARGLTIEHQC
jgi:hypothetical protein